MVKLLIVLHVLGASVWVGGHLLLLLRYLPEALRTRDPKIIQGFEHRYEVIGLPALLLQVITGIMLGMSYDANWFSFNTTVDLLFNLKLILLLLTLALGIHARFFILPRLEADGLRSLALHIAAVTLLAIGFVYVGISFRFGL